MSDPWTSVGTRTRESGAVNVVVETPGGSRSKFRFDQSLGLFQLHKLLPVGAAFPFDFGFVPRTRADDGDPLDVMILGEPTFTGCVVPVRLLGVIQAEQTERGVTIRNDRLIGIAHTPKIHPRERSLADVPPGLLDQIEHFFVAYNRHEGRRFVPIARRGPKIAAKLIEQGITAYQRHSAAGRRRSRAGSTATR